MNSFTFLQKILVFIAPALVLSQIALFQLFVHLWGDTWGYLLGYIIYWFVWCTPVSIIFLKSSLSGMWKLPKASSKKLHLMAVFLVALPAFATGLTVFPQYAPYTGWQVILLALVFTVINAPLEELFWRGVFPSVFPKSLFWGYLYPTFCFGAWHIAPALAKESGMDGGMLSFVGGALFMGILWGWYSYRYRTVLPTTLSHLLTNFFAFSGFIYVNWFA